MECAGIEQILSPLGLLIRFVFDRREKMEAGHVRCSAVAMECAIYGVACPYAEATVLYCVYRMYGGCVCGTSRQGSALFFLFIHSFIHSFIYLCIYVFIYLFIMFCEM